MIIYHGGIGKDIQEVSNEKFNCLITYAAVKKIKWQPWWDKLFIDSGAFSVFNSGKTIDIEKYIDYLLGWEAEKKDIVYAALDVIGDPDASYKNYKLMLKRGLNPLPAYHIGEELIYAAKYIKHTNYIALGGTVGSSPKKRLRFFNTMFELNPDPKKIGYHGFGVTAPPLVIKYPWATIDSTMAMRWGMFGQILTPKGRFTAMNSTNRNSHLSRKGEANIAELKRTWFDTIGVDWDLLLSEDKIGAACKVYNNIKALEYYGSLVPATFKANNNHVLSLLEDE